MSKTAEHLALPLDVWSLGVTAAYVWLRELPWEDLADARYLAFAAQQQAPRPGALAYKCGPV